MLWMFKMSLANNYIKINALQYEMNIKWEVKINIKCQNIYYRAFCVIKNRQVVEELIAFPEVL